MTVWAYTLCYNEATLIPYWVRHYLTFCNKVVVYLDDDTDDDTGYLAHREGAEVRSYSGNGLDDFAFINFAQEHYKEARGHADWVVWTDVDEIVYHPLIEERLAEYKAYGINLPRTVGYSMLASSPPTGPGQIYDEITRGIPAAEYAKVAIFDPALDLQWTAGKHDAYAPGAVHDDGSDPLKLLHYRWLGERYFLERNARNFSRLNAKNKAAQHGKETYPDFQGKYSPSWYTGQLELARPCL